MTSERAPRSLRALAVASASSKLEASPVSYLHLVNFRYEQPTGGGDLGWSILLIVTILVMLFSGFTVWSSVSDKGINSLSAFPVKIFDSKDYEEIVKLHPTLGKK